MTRVTSKYCGFKNQYKMIFAYNLIISVFALLVANSTSSFSLKLVTLILGSNHTDSFNELQDFIVVE